VIDPSYKQKEHPNRNRHLYGIQEARAAVKVKFGEAIYTKFNLQYEDKMDYLQLLTSKSIKNADYVHYYRLKHAQILGDFSEEWFEDIWERESRQTIGSIGAAPVSTVAPIASEMENSEGVSETRSETMNTEITAPIPGFDDKEQQSPYEIRDDSKKSGCEVKVLLYDGKTSNLTSKAAKFLENIIVMGGKFRRRSRRKFSSRRRPRKSKRS
jgi:hypothetical protein